MRRLLLLFLVVVASHAFGQNKAYDYCYTHKKGICVFSLAEKKEYPVIGSKGGTDACISPDGTKVACTANSAKGERTIVVIDLNSKKKTTLNTGSHNCYGPMWSPDGKYIAYNVFNLQTSKWFIAVIGLANGANKVFNGQAECSMPTWTSDSKNIAAQNMNSVFVFDLSGKVIKSFKISDLSKQASPTSSDRYIFTGKKIVFNSEVNQVSDSEEPPTAIYVYDRLSARSVKITPKDYFPYDLTVKKDQVLFSAGASKSTITNIYCVDLDGKNLKVLFKNCSYLTARN